MNSFRWKEPTRQQTASDSSSAIQNRVSLVALSQHKGVTIAADLPALQKSRHSGLTLDLNKEFHAGPKRDAYAGAHDVHAPSNTHSTGISPPSSTIDDSHFNLLSSFVGPSVYQLIPELQRGGSAYSISSSDSSFSDSLSSIGDIDYFWSVIPSAHSVRTEVKAAILDTYSADNNLPTILQPRFKPKAPGTALALWLPTLMASLAKRYNDENPQDLLTSAGDKYKDIIKENIGGVLKRDFDAANWLFKRGTSKQSRSSNLRNQRHGQQRGRDTRLTTKIKHLHRRGDGAGGSTSDPVGGKVRTKHSSKQDKDLEMASHHKPRIKYVQQQDNDLSLDLLEKYDNSPMMSRRRSSNSDSRSSSTEPNTVTPDSGQYAPVFDDDIDDDDDDECEESMMIFFNYSNDGTSYSCTKSPIHTPRVSQASSTCSDTRSVTSSHNRLLENTRRNFPDLDSDSEEEEVLFEESFRSDTEHVNCECIKYARVDSSADYGDFRCLRTLDDNNHQSSSHDHKDMTRCDPSVKKAPSKPKRKIPRSRQRRITDAGRKPRNSHRDDDDDELEEEVNAKDVPKPKQDKEIRRTSQCGQQDGMRDKLEYMIVASNEKADISVTLYIRMPDELLHLCNIKTHLLLCAMRAFFLCTDGIHVRWVKTLQYKIYQLLQRKDTNIKFSDEYDDGEGASPQSKKACLMLSHDASVLLRDRHSSLLTSVADILQVETDNVIVLEQAKKVSEQAKKVVPDVTTERKKSKTKRKSLSIGDDYMDYNRPVAAAWYLPLML